MGTATAARRRPSRWIATLDCHGPTKLTKDAIVVMEKETQRIIHASRLTEPDRDALHEGDVCPGNPKAADLAEILPGRDLRRQIAVMALVVLRE